MNKEDMPIFPLISALTGYRLIVIDTKQMPYMTDRDIMISRGLYNKMRDLCPDLFPNTEEKNKNETKG